jgi:hypothetical protein
MGFFEIGSHKQFAWAGFELWSSFSLLPEQLGLYSSSIWCLNKCLHLHNQNSYKNAGPLVTLEISPCPPLTKSFVLQPNRQTLSGVCTMVILSCLSNNRIIQHNHTVCTLLQNFCHSALGFRSLFQHCAYIPLCLLPSLCILLLTNAWFISSWCCYEQTHNTIIVQVFCVHVCLFHK